MKSVVLWSVLSSGYWFVEDFKTIISLSSQVMLRMPMSSFEADTQCNKEKQYIFFQLSNQHEWTKPLWTCLRNVGKKPVKIKQEFPSDGKYVRAGLVQFSVRCQELSIEDSSAGWVAQCGESKAVLCCGWTATKLCHREFVCGRSCTVLRDSRCSIPQMFNKM